MPASLVGLAEALLIGLVIGAQREAAQDERQAGARDFFLIALAGGICGLINSALLTAAALLVIGGILAVFHWEARTRTGITTEMAAVATFCLCVLATHPARPLGAGLSIGAALIVVVFLEAKRALHTFLRQTITEREFNDTIWFLALIFIIYPILPAGSYGPYAAFSPRQIWLFVILVSSISFAGYFLEKFLGAGKGLAWTSLLGGLASTTAATLAFARGAREKPEERRLYWSALAIANAIQFPRVLAILYVVNSRLAYDALSMLAVMTAAGLLFGGLLYRRSEAPVAAHRLPTGNPFRLIPALKFGALFAAVMFLSKAAAAELGDRGVYWASTAGGAVDVDAVSVSLAHLELAGAVSLATARTVLFVALLMNAVIKSGLAAWAGGAAFALRAAGAFVAMFAAGALALGMGGWS
jgi:uncharacterized membrane protein (DUF4010 family)